MPYFALIIMFYHVKIVCYQHVCLHGADVTGGGIFLFTIWYFIICL